MKFAKWIETRNIQGLKFSLRSGKKGAGRELFSCNSWDNSRALENADILCNAAEQRFLAMGFIIIQNEEN